MSCRRCGGRTHPLQIPGTNKTADRCEKCGLLNEPQAQVSVPVTTDEVAQADLEIAQKEIRRLRRGVTKVMQNIRGGPYREGLTRSMRGIFTAISEFADELEELLYGDGDPLPPEWDHHKEDEDEGRDRL